MRCARANGSVESKRNDFASLDEEQRVGLDQRSYSTLGPVSVWMGDRVRTGKPPRRSTRHPGLLSLSHPSVGRRNGYKAKAGEVNRHIAWYTSMYPWSCSVGLVSGWKTRLRRSAPMYGKQCRIKGGTPAKKLISHNYTRRVVYIICKSF